MALFAIFLRTYISQVLAITSISDTSVVCSSTVHTGKQKKVVYMN